MPGTGPGRGGPEGARTPDIRRRWGGLRRGLGGTTPTPAIGQIPGHGKERARDPAPTARTGCGIRHCPGAVRGSGAGEPGHATRGAPDAGHRTRAVGAVPGRAAEGGSGAGAAGPERRRERSAAGAGRGSRAPLDTGAIPGDGRARGHGTGRCQRWAGNSITCWYVGRFCQGDTGWVMPPRARWAMASAHHWSPAAQWSSPG